MCYIYMGIMCTHHVHLCRHRHSARATNHCSRVINRGVSYNRATTLCTAGDGVMVAERNMGSVEDISNHPSHEWLPLLTSAIVNHCMNHYQHLSTIIDHYSQWFTGRNKPSLLITNCSLVPNIKDDMNGNNTTVFSQLYINYNISPTVGNKSQP